MTEMVCPFCGYRSQDGEQMMQLHIEEQHTEDSPFVIRDHMPQQIRSHSPRRDASSSNDSMPTDTWTKCTRPGCGQHILLADADEHLRLHDIEALTGNEEEQDLEGETSPRKRRRRRPSASQSSRDMPSITNSPKQSHTDTRSKQRPAHTLLQYFSGTSYVGRQQRQRPPPLKSDQPSRRIITAPREPGRLGKHELGPQAFEEAMPPRVREYLLNAARPLYINRIGCDGRLSRDMYVENETPGIIPILSDLCALDPDTEATYFCDPNVKHIVKLNCDGNFCGYWNIQMLLSHMRGRDHRDRPELQTLPNVLEIQDTIEQAWDNGICPYGRIETGGIRGARKWIGTHEAVAYFTQLGVRVEALSFQDEESETKIEPAVMSLLDHVEAYFMSGLERAHIHGTSRVTRLSPIYFQRLGHSMTIVGLERKLDGSRNLLVFDPSFATSNAMRRLLRGSNSYAAPEALLRAYRRSDASLASWKEFEIVVPQPYRPETPS